MVNVEQHYIRATAIPGTDTPPQSDNSGENPLFSQIRMRGIWGLIASLNKMADNFRKDATEAIKAGVEQAKVERQSQRSSGRSDGQRSDRPSPRSSGK